MHRAGLSASAELLVCVERIICHFSYMLCFITKALISTVDVSNVHVFVSMWTFEQFNLLIHLLYSLFSLSYDKTNEGLRERTE